MERNIEEEAELKWELREWKESTREIETNEARLEGMDLKQQLQRRWYGQVSEKVLLDENMVNVRGREKWLNVKTRSVSMLIARLKRRERNMNSRERKIDLRGRNMDKREMNVYSREKSVEFLETELTKQFHELELKEKRLVVELGEKIKDAELKQKWSEKREARVARMVARLKKEERKLDSRKRSLNILEKKLVKRLYEVELKEERFVADVDESKRRLRELDEKIKDVEAKEIRLNYGKGTNVNTEILLYKGEENAHLDLFHADIRLHPGMNGRNLQMFMNSCIEDHERMCYAMRVILLRSSDPAQLVLDAMQGFYADEPEDESVGFDLSIVKKSCILLLELLMQLNPPIKRQIKEKATQLAAHWRRNFGADCCPLYLKVVGFLQLVTTYGLAYAFDGIELAALVEIAALHPRASGSWRRLGISPKALAKTFTSAHNPPSAATAPSKEKVVVEAWQPSSLKYKSAAPMTTDLIKLTIGEKITAFLKRDGSVRYSYVHGHLSIQVSEEKDAYIQVQVEFGGVPGIMFVTHHSVDKELFRSFNILRLKDSNRPLLIGPCGDCIHTLEWRMRIVDDSALPLTISCTPSRSDNQTSVDILYESPSMFDLENVVIAVPLPTNQSVPVMKQIDGEWRYDSKNSILEWSIAAIDRSNRSGSMKFVVSSASDTSEFFPISVRFSATGACCGLKVASVSTLKQGTPKNFIQRNLFELIYLKD